MKTMCKKFNNDNYINTDTESDEISLDVNNAHKEESLANLLGSAHYEQELVLCILRAIETKGIDIVKNSFDIADLMNQTNIKSRL